MRRVDVQAEDAVRRKRAAEPVKTWFCRSCRAEVESKGIPAGWYSVWQLTGEVVNVGLGLFCCSGCLVDGARKVKERAEVQMPVKLADTAVRP
ncbi:MAG: hypothetical protein ACYDHN_01670 [Solirubrobacteraceae bacterium]